MQKNKYYSSTEQFLTIKNFLETVFMETFYDNTYLKVLFETPFKFKFYFCIEYILNLNSKINVYYETVDLKLVYAVNLYIIPLKILLHTLFPMDLMGGVLQLLSSQVILKTKEKGNALRE